MAVLINRELTWLVLGDSGMDRSLNLPTRISKVRGLNWAQSHILFRQS